MKSQPSLFAGNQFRKGIFFLLALVISVSFFSQASFGTENAGEVKAQSASDHKTLVISVPRTTWDLLDKAETPSIDSLISKGSVASMSVRSESAVTSPSEGYASLSAGNRAGAVDMDRSTFVGPEENWNGFISKELFENQRGKLETKNAAGLALGFEMTLKVNENGFYKSKVGLLHDQLDANSRSIAVFGNADFCDSEDPACFDRSVGYFGTDTNGVLHKGDISRDLVIFSENDSTEVALDLNVVQDRAKESLDENDVTVVECSDLERLEKLKSTSKSDLYESRFLKKLSECDQMIGKILESVSLQKDRVYLLSPTSPSGTNQTTVFVSAGKNVPVGYTTSASTRHKGSVTLVDIAPTILDDYSIEIPKEMNNTLLEFDASEDSSIKRVDYLIKTNDEALAREVAIGPVTLTLVALFVLSIALSMIVFSRTKKWSFAVRFLVLLTAFYPTTTYLLRPFYTSFALPLGLILVTLLISGILALGAYFVNYKYGKVFCVLAVALFNLLVHLIDIIFGGNLQFNSTFGHSPIIAGRFSGFSNQAFAIITISMILIVAMVVELVKAKPKAYRNKVNFALLGFMIFVLIMDGAPFFGSDVGGVLALTPTIFVVAMIIFEKRIGIKTILTSIFATLVTLIGFAAIDLSRPVSKRTHLGRFAESVINGDAGVTIERKLAASLRTFQSSSWVIILVSFVAYVLFMYLQDKELLKENMNSFPGFKLIVYSGAVAGFLGMALNDSGASIPAMMLVVALVPITLYTLNPESKDVEAS